MKILFFTHKHISHLLPIDDLITNLKKNHELFCIGYNEREDYFRNKGIEFFSYPDEKFDKLNQEYNYLYSKELEGIQENNVDKWYRFYLEKNALMMHYITENGIQELTNIVKKINPDVVFHDVVDLYAPIICNRLRIRRFDYITNPLYSEKFFNDNPEELYSILTLKYNADKQFLKKYIRNYWDIQKKVFNYVEKRYGLIAVPPMNQFEMTGEKNIIFNCKFIQPQCFDNDFIIVPPHRNQFIIETEIDKKLEDFIIRSNRKKIIYISHGSFLTMTIKYYERIFDDLKALDLNYIISCRTNLNELKKMIHDKKMENRVYCDTFLPQKFVLSKADLFITSGGFNSILESINFKVPMIIDPISAEQRMNGYIIDKLKIGKSLCLKNSQKSIRENVEFLLDNNIYKNNIQTFNRILKKEINERKNILDSILKYIE